MKFPSLLLALCAACALPLSAQQMSYQGRLTDNTGAAVPGLTAALTFSIWDAATGGNKVWGDQVINADLLDGRFSVKLGPTDATSRPLSGAFSGARFIQIQVGTSTPLPRQEMLAAPLAFSALNANLNGVGFKSSIARRPTIGSANDNPNFSFDGTDGLLIETGFSESSGIFLNNNTVSIYSPANNGNILSLYDEDAFDSAGEIPQPQFSVQNSGGFTAAGDSTISANLSISGSLNLPGKFMTLGNSVGIGNALTINPATPTDANPGTRLHVSNLQYGIAPTAIFEGVNCGAPCGQSAWTEITRLWNSNPNGRAGMSFMTRANGGITQVPDVYVGTGDGFNGDANDFRIATNVSGNLNDRLYINGATGAIGIGTTAPDRAMLEVNTALFTSTTFTNRFFDTNGTGGPVAPQNRNMAIFANGDVACNTLRAFSDERIKTAISITDNVQDLQTLGQLQISNYHYIDSITEGDKPQKKLIAQQVEKVYPMAVVQSKNVIPDIFQKATAAEGWVFLATDLKVGERVRLVGDKTEIITEVAEVREGGFRPAELPEGKLFVYGREVNDFRTVDYDAISMLNVSATQELAKQVKEKDAKIAALEDRLAALEKSVAILAAAEAPGGPVRKETAGR